MGNGESLYIAILADIYDTIYIYNSYNISNYNDFYLMQYVYILQTLTS